MSVQDSNKFFDNIYKNSGGDGANVPWATLEANKYLLEYLGQNTVGGKAIVIGCGLGDDAVALEKAGFDVTAIDVSQTAIDWCRERFSNCEVNFQIQDIFELPQDMIGAYDFIFESRTIQSLALEYRNKIIGAISSLMAPDAKALVVADGKQDHEKHDGPPWPLTVNELRLFMNHNCEELEFSIYEGEKDTSSLKLRALFKKC